MGKALKSIIIGAVIIGAAFLTGGASLVPSLTLPATGAVVGGFLATTTLGGLALAFGATEILTGIASSFAKKPSVTTSTLDRLNASLVPTTPRVMVFGQDVAAGTDIRYTEPSGDNQRYIDYIIAVAAHKVTAIREIWLENTKAWDSASGVQSGYAGFLTVDVRAEGTAANAISINSGTVWNASNCRLTGCAYIHIRVDRGGTNSPFASGLNSRITIRVDGIPVYDPRLDSTVAGGSGSHRADDQTTWQFQNGSNVLANNVALQALTWLLGWRIGGKVSVGRGMSPARLDLAGWITAANLCDETVTTSTGTQPRYHGGGVASEGDDPGTVMTNFATTCNGRFRETIGKLGLIVMHNDLALADADPGLGDDEMIGQGTLNPDPSLEECYNVVRGRYVDPSDASLYQLVDYPEVRLDSLDGIDRVLTLDLPWVMDAAMAQRLAKQTLERKQYDRQLSVVVNMAGWSYKIGDIVPITIGALGFNRQLMRVEQQIAGFDGTCPMILTWEDPAIYAWDADDRAAVTAATPIYYDPANDPLLVAIRNAAGTQAWTPVIDQWKLDGGGSFESVSGGFAGSVQSVESLQYAEVSGVITSATNNVIVGLYDPVTDTAWGLYTYPTSGTALLDNFSYPPATDITTVDTHVAITPGDVYSLRWVGGVLHGFINSTDVGAMPNSPAPTTPLKVLLLAQQTGAQVQSVTFTKAGADGDGGPILTLQSTAQAYTYNGDGTAYPAGQSITFTAVIQGTIGTATFAGTLYNASGGVISTSPGWTVTGNTAVMPISAFGAAAYMVVTVSLAGLTDTETVVRLVNGSDAVTPLLTNEAATVSADSVGAVASFSNAGGTMELFKGSALLTSGVSYAVASHDAALSISINSSTGAYTVTGLTADQATATLSATYNGVTYTKVYTISKSKAGANAPVLTLSSTAQTVTFDSTGAASPSSQTLTFTANLAGGLTGTATWAATAYNASSVSLGAVTLGGSGNTRTLTNAQFTAPGATAYVVITASLSGLSDTETVVKLQQGSNAITGLLTNESATVAADSSGTVASFSAAGGTFKMYNGTTDITTGGGVSYSIASSSGVTGSINSSTGVYSISAMSADQGNIVFQAQVTIGGVVVTVTKNYNIAKSKAGAAGAAGAAGTGTLTMAVTDTMTFNAGVLDNATSGGGYNVGRYGAYSTMPNIPGSCQLTIQPSNVYGTSGDIMIGLESTPNSSFNYSTLDGGFRFAGAATGLGSGSTPVEVWFGGTMVYYENWVTTNSYGIRYDSISGNWYYTKTTSAGVVTTMYIGAGTAGMAFGVTGQCGLKGRATISFGAAGSNGSGSGGGLPAVVITSFGNTAFPSITVKAGQTVTYTLSGTMSGTTSASKMTLQLNQQINGGTISLMTGNPTNNVLVTNGAGDPSINGTATGTYTNSTGADVVFTPIATFTQTTGPGSVAAGSRARQLT
jgi:hypothetical protein